MEFQSTEAPQLLDCAAKGAGQGEKLQTVLYNNRLLYSKYDPQRAVLSLIQKNAPIDKGSLVLVFSPCLFYGLEELLAAMDGSASSGADVSVAVNAAGAGADILAVEADGRLHELARRRLTELASGGPVQRRAAHRVALFSAGELAALDNRLRELAATGRYRRVLRLDFSAGTAFAPAFYAQVAAAAQEIIASFWKNQITLVRMGRLFAKNIFQNLPLLASCPQLHQLERTVRRPLLVCGAGESLNTTEIPADGCFTIAVDAALPSLLARGARVDAVVSLESQLAIQKAYIGAAAPLAATPPLLFADISSRPSVPRSFPNRTVLFASRYAPATYLDRLQERGLVHDYVPPMGSVGLAAVYIALRLRAGPDVDVFVTGLDFSYSAGRTHADMAPADIQRKSSSSRLCPAENYAAAFGPAAIPTDGKDGGRMVSMQSMLAYARQFRSFFAGQQRLWDLGRTGVDLGLARADGSALREAAARAQQEGPDATLPGPNPASPAAGPSDGSGPALADRSGPAPDMPERLASFLQEEKEALTALKDLLMHGEASPCRDASVSLDAQIASLLAGREYLHLHFPDGYRASTDTAFLKRVRAELDFFLKQIGLAGRQ